MAARLVPTLRYRDIAAAADWLCSAFGFKRMRIVTGVDGSIQQAHLGFGNDVIMLLPARDFGVEAAAPDLAVADMQSCYFVVDDADQHHRRAKAAGAEILDIRQYDLGGRGYSCRDPEGHVWSFGTYNPRQRQPEPESTQQQAEFRRPQYDPWTATRSPATHRAGPPIADAAVGRPPIADAAAGRRPRLTLASVTTALATVVVAAATIGWLLGALPRPAASARDTRDSKLANRLAADGPGKVVDNPKSASTEPSTERAKTPERVQAPERTQPGPLSFGSSAIQQRAVEEEKPAVPHAPQLAKEATPEPPANLAVSEQGAEQAAKEAAERAALDALKQWREAQEKLRQLARERSAKEAAEQAELEARQRAAAKAARGTPRAPVNTEPPKRAAAAKEAPKPAVKEAPAKASAPERTGVQTAKADASKDTRQAPAKQAEAATSDCPTDPTSGKAVCPPRKKEPTARAAEPVVRAAKMGSAEQAGAEPPKRAEPAPSASSDQIWDCVPRPPEGKVICHPIPNRP